MGKHEDKNLKNILEGKDIEKKIQVGGYDKEFSDEMKKKEEKERKQSEALSKILAEVRMPLFCPECQNVMNKRIDKRMWMRLKKCSNCVIKEEHEMRVSGKWEEYENKKIKANVLSWLRDQEVQFEEWKKLIQTGGESIISDETGTQEHWKQNKKESEELVDKMQIEFDNMKTELLQEIDSK